MKVHINERFEYDHCVKQGYQPLINPVFVIDHNLRVDIQRELFGHSFLSKGNVATGNQRFYSWVWKVTGPVRHCQECGRPLEQYSSAFISHILSRKGYPEMAHDPRNVNLLCPQHHHQWENSPKSMNIYEQNQQIINTLKHEYRHNTHNVIRM